jgi:hypothetical protein
MDDIKNKKNITVHCGGLSCCGSVTAVVLSWIANKSVIWCCLHFFCSWLYVLYWVLCRSSLYDWLCSVCR